ncbi:MAG TPA: LPS-assembly protein LptD [Anaeromyxobacter sp.]|nr:LPS-assembly protein LptD [Anaeromyxobacter sp.]
MTSFAALTAAALLAGLTAPPAGLPAASGDVSFEAAQVVFRGETGRYELAGGAVVRRGGVVLRAARATVDPETGEVWASGGVLLLDATRAVQAGTIHAVLDGPFEASEVVAFLKEKPLDPVRITSLAEARRGRNRLSLTAERVEGDADGRLGIDGARLTLCDCGPGRAPTWELAAGRAKVDGDRLSLSWPVLRVTPRFVGVTRPVPVLALPWLSLPLRDRQSGLLFPEISVRSVTGVAVGLPVYFTVGRSADLTLTPEYFFGPDDPDQPGGAVEGPGLGVEVRWAPAERAYGEVRLHLVQDLDRERLRPPPEGSGALGAGGPRLSIVGTHRQGLGAATRLVGNLALAQDAFFFRDLPAAGLPDDAYYSRSDLLVSHRRARWVLEGGAAYFEPLAHDDRFRPGAPSWFGLSLPALHRWPSVAALLLPSGGGGLELQGRLGITRFAPFEGHAAPLLPTDPGFPRTADPDQAPARPPPAPGVVPLPREAVTRAEARLQLSLPALLGRSISVEPWLRGAVTGYAFDAVDPTAAAWGVAGLSASAELARRSGGVEHRIVPRVELLAGTAPWRPRGDRPFPAFDLWDRVDLEAPAELDGADAVVVQGLSAAPGGAYAQARAMLGTRLAGPDGSLGLTLGQDGDLRAGRLAESFAAVNAARGPLRLDGSVRFLAFGGRPPRAPGWERSWLDELTRLRLGASLRDRRGDALHVSLDAAGAGAVGAQGAGVDALFDLRPSTAPPEAWYRAGARLVLGGAALEYELKLTARHTPTVSCRGGESRADVDAGEIVDQRAAVAWDSPCRCFTVRVRASRDACDNMTYGLDVDLSKILQGAATKRP